MQLFRRRKASAKFAGGVRMPVNDRPSKKGPTGGGFPGSIISGAGGLAGTSKELTQAAADLYNNYDAGDPGVDEQMDDISLAIENFTIEAEKAGIDPGRMAGSVEDFTKYHGEGDNDAALDALQTVNKTMDRHIEQAGGMPVDFSKMQREVADKVYDARRDSDQGGGEDAARDAVKEALENRILHYDSPVSSKEDHERTKMELGDALREYRKEKGGGPYDEMVLSAVDMWTDPDERENRDRVRDALKDEEEGGGERKAPDDEPSGPRKRCPKGSRKDDSGTCQKYSEAEATDPAPKKKTLRERLGAKKKCDSGCPDDNDGRQAKQFKAPPGREAQVKALKKEDVENPYAVAWSSYDAKNSESYAPICFSDNQLPGGDFDAVQNEDGTWNIGIDKDIPIMGTVQEVGVKGNERPIGIKWLRAALRKHRALEEQPGGAYYAPVHLRHHSENSDHDETVPAGFLRLNRIAPAFDGGDNQAAIFATLYNVPDEIYQQIKARKWAFRSVEVASWDKPQVSSLSLLNTEAPFFKYPNLTIGNETPAVAVNVLPLEAAAPALALCESGAGGSILFNFSEARRMAEEKIKEEIEIEEDLDLNDEDVDVDVDVDEDEGATLAEVAGLMRELMKRLDDEEEEIIEDTEVRDKRNEDVPVDIAASEGKMAAMLSELSGRVSGIESNQRKGRQRQALSSYVEKSLGKLSGYNLPDSLGDTMTKMAQTAGGNYKKLLDQFVSTFKATASRDEDLATLDDFEQSISIGQGDEALAKFAQKGEASLTNARKHLRTFKSLQDKGVRFADGVDDPANFIDILTNETNTEN